MTKKWLVFILVFSFAVGEEPPYRPRGWRPDGRSFNPGRLRSYGPPPPQNTYGPENGGPYPTATGLPDAPTTSSTTTTTETPTTTTPKTREPTTPFEEDLANGPALAVANSFAFNRPVYVYNSFPYYSAYTVLK